MIHKQFSANWASQNGDIKSVVKNPHDQFNNVTLSNCFLTTSRHSLFDILWRRQMETFFALLALCAGNSPVTGEFPTPWPVTRSFDSSLICARMNDWVNNHAAGDLRRHCTYCDGTVMLLSYLRSCNTATYLNLKANKTNGNDNKTTVIRSCISHRVN